MPEEMMSWNTRGPKILPLVFFMFAKKRTTSIAMQIELITKLPKKSIFVLLIMIAFYYTPVWN